MYYEIGNSYVKLKSLTLAVEVAGIAKRGFTSWYRQR